MKECRRCSAQKPVGEFYADRRTPDGLRTWCKDCWNAYSRSRWASGVTDRTRKAVRDKAWREANPEKQRAITRRNNLKRSYGITVEEYDAMFAAQNGCCAACGTTDSGDPRFDTFSVDHDHATGDVRGLLCSNCNRALGLARDSVDTLMSLAAYLLKSRDVLGVGTSA